MNPEMQKQLAAAIGSELPLNEIVTLLRGYRDQGVAQADVYLFLERMHQLALDEAMDDRILEVADFVAGFCAPHMKIWDGKIMESMQR